MERITFDALECEANGMTPGHVIKKEKADRVARLLDIQEKEQMTEWEPGQNFGVAVSSYTPINTTK